MKTFGSFAAALACCLGAGLLAPAAADPAPAQPKFKDAPVIDILKWAQDSLGAGFIYEAADLNGEDGKPRRVTADTPAPADARAKRLLLFELLRRCELVAFEVEGLPGPTYQLVRGRDAARHAPFVEDERRLHHYYFAAFAVRLARADIARVSAELSRHLTAGVGHIEVFAPTHTMIICDFTDRLQAALAFARAADTAAMRDDDLVLQDFVPRNGRAKLYSLALERLRAPGEDWKLALHESSNVLLLSGKRDELARVAARLQKLDSNPASPAFVEDSFTARLVHIGTEDAARVLREMFAAEIAAFSVQIAPFEKTRSIVFRGSAADFDRAKATLKLIDVEAK